MAKILAIDDEELVRFTIREMLGAKGHEVSLAANGEEGMALLAGVDLVICDLEMPAMDGFEFVERLRADEKSKNSNIPVLILTGHIEKESVEKSVNLGIHGYLKKPFSEDSLEQKVIRALFAPAIDPKRLKR